MGLAQAKLLIEAPVNGGRNYNGRHSRGLRLAASIALTAYRNLSALVTCHTLYFVFTIWQSAVFLLNSRLTHFTATYN